jgi:hypothetical protein
VNRLFIDLIGREPTDEEMDDRVTSLRENSLSEEARIELIQELMFSEAPVEGDTSYTLAYFNKLYGDFKARFLEGASQATILEEYNLQVYLIDFLTQTGDIQSAQIMEIEAAKTADVLNVRTELRTGAILVDEACRRMCFNSIYDDINMNSFNFLNASFDQLFFRFPTQAEFDQVYPVIEYNLAGTLFGQAIQNKQEYLSLMTSVDEFAEGMIRWAYLNLLSRDPNSAEVLDLMDEFQNDFDYQTVQQKILISDEYAGFD